MSSRHSAGKTIVVDTDPHPVLIYLNQFVSPQNVNLDESDLTRWALTKARRKTIITPYSVDALQNLRSTPLGTCSHRVVISMY